MNLNLIMNNILSNKYSKYRILDINKLYLKLLINKDNNNNIILFSKIIDVKSINELNKLINKIEFNLI